MSFYLYIHFFNVIYFFVCLSFLLKAILEGLSSSVSPLLMRRVPNGSVVESRDPTREIWRENRRLLPQVQSIFIS